MINRVFMGLILAIGMSAPSLAEETIGEIKLVRGSATVERNGQTAPAELGMQVEEKDLLNTGPEGALGLAFTDGSRVSLGANSELRVETYRFDGEGAPGNAFDSRLTKGSLAAASGMIAKTPDAMRVLMPTTILGVRGTEFAVSLDEE